MNAVDKTNYSMPEITNVSGTITGASGVTVFGDSYVKQYGNIVIGHFSAEYTLSFVPPTDAFVEIATISGVDMPNADITFIGVNGSNAVALGKIGYGNGAVSAYVSSGQTTGRIMFTIAYIA